MSEAKAVRSVGLNMAEGNLFSKMVRFAIPILIANLVQQLYNTVDLIIIGRYVGSIGTVGVSTGGDIVNLLTNLGMGFSMGAMIYISQLVGARMQEKISETIGTLISTMLVVSVVFALFSIVLCKPLLQLMHCPEEAFQQATNYMIITALGLPFIYGYNAICNVLRGMGESKKPLQFILIAASSNVVLDILFVVVIPMEAAGTAIATVAAQAISCIAAVVYLYRNRVRFAFEFKPASFRIRREELSILTRLGIPKALKMCMINFSILYCTSMINSYGLIASATNSIGNKVVRFGNLFMNSMDQATSTAVGQNLGAKQPKRARQAVYRTLAMASSICALLILVCIFLPRQIFGVFNQDPAVLELGETFMHIQILNFIFAAISCSYNGVISGSGNVGLEFVVGLLDGVILRISISVILANYFHMDVLGYFIGHSTARIAPCIIGMVYFYSGAWERRTTLAERVKK